jgi:hypothetical protein
MSEPIDLSDRRDAEVGILYHFYLVKGDSIFGVLKARPDSSDFNDWDYYRTYTGRKVVMTRELIKRINLGEIVLKAPDAVFRDFQFQPNTGQKYVVEYWLGRVLDAGRLLYVKALVVNDTVKRLSLARDLNELKEIISDISGLRVYKKA